MVNKSAPGYPHTITPTVPRMLDTMHDFKRQGLSQIMPYDAIVLPPSVRSEFVNGMDHVRKQLFTPLVRY
jgi:hypothetical protein